MGGAPGAWLWLVRIGIARQVRGRKLWLAIALMLAVAVVVGLAGAAQDGGWTARRFAEMVAMRLLGLFFVPLVALMYGTGAIAEERDDRTLVHLLTKPLPRSAIYSGRLVASLVIAVALTLAALALATLAASLRWNDEISITETLGVLLAPVLWASIAYTAFFGFLGALFRHGVTIGLAYAFFIELVVGRAPGVLKRITINFWSWSMVYDSELAAEVHPRAIFLPVSRDSGELALWIIAAACWGLGAVSFAVKDHRES